MGCFDYECECGGSTCAFVGRQDGGESTVVVEVPLNDDTTVYVKGQYESYGYVRVGEYMFYLNQFKEHFDGWLERESDESRSKIFVATRVWTVCYNHVDYDDDWNERVTPNRVTTCLPSEIVVKARIGLNTIKKCIRADADLNIPSYGENQKARIARLKADIERMQRQLDETTSR